MRTNNEAATVTMNHHLTFTKPQLLMAFESHETIRRPGQDAVVALDEKSTALPLPKERSRAAERCGAWEIPEDFTMVICLQ